MEKHQDSRTERPPVTVGKTVGGAFGLSIGILLAMRTTWMYFLIAFSPIITPIPFLFVSFILIALGAIVGVGLAKAGFVPALRRMWALGLAIVVAVGPLVVGFGEVWLRGAPFSLPSSTEISRWVRTPWGTQLLYLESPEPVAALQHQLVANAKEAGWVCDFCQYQPSTGTGHASFESTDARPGGPGGTAGFEIWPGERSFYGTETSELTQIRISNQERSWSIEWTMLGLAVALGIGMALYSKGRASA